MISFDVRHCGGGKTNYESEEGNIESLICERLEELNEADNEHYQMSFKNSDGNALSVYDSSMCAYTDYGTNQEVPDEKYYQYTRLDELVHDIKSLLLLDYSFVDKYSSEIDLSDQTIFPTKITEFPLHDFVFRNNLKYIKKYVSLGYDVNRIDDYGETPMIIAINENRVQILQYLIDNGADTQKKDKNGVSALELAKDKPDILKILNK